MPPMFPTRRTVAVLTSASLLAVGLSVGATHAGGPAAAPSDFNGDGWIDLAIGAPYDDVGGDAGAGVVHVLYGSSMGLRSTGDQVWHQDRDGIPDSAEPGDHFGWALASADFDVDGYADLAIGVPDEDLVVSAATVADRGRTNGRAGRPAGGGLGPTVDSGAVLILRGGPGGLTAAGRTWLAPAYDSPGQNGNRYGAAMAAADFFFDNHRDLAIAQPGANEGRGGVLLQDGACLGGGVCIDTVYQFGDFDEGAGAGSALVAGQFDGVGKVDLAIGVPYADTDGLFAAVTDSGLVRVVYPSGGASVDLIRGGALGGTREPGDHLGLSLGTVDFDRNGEDTLLIGVPDDDLGGLVDAGQVHAWGEGTLDQGSPGVPGSRQAHARFGASFATADFGKGEPYDLAIGAPGWNRPGAARAGAVVILYGTEDGPKESGNKLLTQDTSGIADGAEANDRFGATLFAGDLGKSAQRDLAIGVPRESVNGKVRAGLVQVLYGKGTGLSVTGDQRWNQDSSGIAEIAQTGDRFGAALR